GLRGHLDQVEVGLCRQTECVLDTNDADLLPVGSDQPHLRDTDTVIDARLADVLLLSSGGPHTKKGSPSVARSLTRARARSPTPTILMRIGTSERVVTWDPATVGWR